MERPETDSLTNFTHGTTRDDQEWYSASFRRGEIELEASRYPETYSVRWDTRTPADELFETLEPFYRFAGRMEVSTPDYMDRMISLDSEADDRIGLYRLDDEEVKKLGLKADGFQVTWRQHGELLEHVPGCQPYSLTFYFEETPENGSDPFVEPVWHTLRTTENLRNSTVDQLVNDAGSFLRDADDQF